MEACKRTFDSLGALDQGTNCPCGHTPYIHTDHCALCEVVQLMQEFRSQVENLAERVITQMNNRIARQ